VALDTLCFEVAHLDGAPAAPGRGAFPITAHPNEWPERTKHLESVPRSILDRIRRCQPWARQDPQSPDPLDLISRIDNGDKHRAKGVAMEVLPWTQWRARPTLPLPEDLANTVDWPLTMWMSVAVDPTPERGQGSVQAVRVGQPRLRPDRG
jgi:hypothetical protein